MKISKRIMSLLTATFFIFALSINIADASSKESLVGSGRWETAIKISQNGWKDATNAILVNDNSIADALSATPFAKLKDAPILLTQSDKLDSRTKAELKRLGVKNVYLIGGMNTLSTNIEKQLKSENMTFERISGNSRYETSLKLAERLDKEKSISDIVVVNGEKGLADAVSVGSAAAQENMPIILSDPNNGIKVANSFISSKNIKKSYIIGGTYSVSSSIEQSLPNVKRLSGNNRNETNAKVLEEFYKNTDLKNVYITKDGMKKQGDLIDSLAVGVLAAKNSSPVVLVGNSLDSSQYDVLNTKSFDNIVQVGGNGNEDAVKDILDLQEETIYRVKTADELDVALRKADANDIITFKPDDNKKITSSFSIETKKAITVELEGLYTQTITVNMPNGELTNKGTLDGTVKIMDIKNGTFINEGDINDIDIYDPNGCKIENKSGGDIWVLTISSSAKDVNIENKGDISKVTNNSTSVIIRNSGNIDTLSGINAPAISGNKPRVDDTDKDEKRASGIYPTSEPLSPARAGYISVKIFTKPEDTNYKIYYRVVSSRPSALYIGDRIDTSDWTAVPSSVLPFTIKAENGYYIEAVEINSDTKKVSRWGKSDYIDDGFYLKSETAKGLSADIDFDGDYVKLTATGADSGCTVYYRIVSKKPVSMNVGDKVTISDWDEITTNRVRIEANDVKDKYIELVELDDSTNKVTRWGASDKVVE
ncbi:TPA: cell wall-binding repeat-containing protein [Clostridioides difficile]